MNRECWQIGASNLEAREPVGFRANVYTAKQKRAPSGSDCIDLSSAQPGLEADHFLMNGMKSQIKRKNQAEN